MNTTEAQLEEMQKASNSFYHSAVTIGVHPFIEFTGLMNEYIKAVRRQGSAGSAHTGNPVHLQDYEVEYIREKLDCIFGDQV